jgi:endonuclease/exonuclease/phosphatase family metal-dependent hydrolase
MISGSFAPLMGSSLEVMSFNVRYGKAADGANHWTHRESIIHSMFDDHRPQILGLQEALDFQIESILGKFPGYASVGVSRDGGEVGEFCSILFDDERFDVLQSGTFWLSETPELPSKSWESAFPRICTWAQLWDSASDSVIWVFNTHFDHMSEWARNESAKLLLRRVESMVASEPVVIMGDFNATPDSAAMETLLEQTQIPLVDTAENRSKTGTFHGFKGNTDGDRIDYILIGNEMTYSSAGVLTFNIEGRFPSDHFPITIDLNP